MYTARRSRTSFYILSLLCDWCMTKMVADSNRIIAHLQAVSNTRCCLADACDARVNVTYTFFHPLAYMVYCVHFSLENRPQAADGVKFSHERLCWLIQGAPQGLGCMASYGVLPGMQPAVTICNSAVRH